MRKSNFSIMNKPALYVKVNDLSHRIASYFIDEFSEEIGEMSGRCLDVGSGPGDLAVDLILPALNTKSSLVCSDISEIMLNFAKEKYQDNERLSFLKLDIDSPNLLKDLVEQFDHVTSFWCIQLCQNMRQVFQNILDLLRPGGSTFLLFIARSPGEDCYEELAAMPRYQPYMKDADRYISPFQHSSEPRKTLKALIKDVGFEIHHCSVREKGYTFISPDLLSEFLLSLDPFIDRMPANLANDYMKDLVNEYARSSLMFNKNNETEDEYSVLIRYQLFIVYLKKPLANNK